MGVSGPSLHIESTDSMILSLCWSMLAFTQYSELLPASVLLWGKSHSQICVLATHIPSKNITPITTIVT